MLKLPPEILVNVFSYNTVPELFKLRQVCRIFEQVIHPLIELEIKVEESQEDSKSQLCFSMMPRYWESTDLARVLPQVSYDTGKLDCWLEFASKIIIDMSSLNMGSVEMFLRYFHGKNFDFKLSQICLRGFWPVHHINSHLSLLHYVKVTYPNCNTFLQICLSKVFEKNIKECKIKLTLWPSVQSVSVVLYGSRQAAGEDGGKDYGFLFDFLEVPQLNNLQNFTLRYYPVNKSDFQIEMGSRDLSKALANCANLRCLALHNILVKGPSSWNPTKAKVFPYENIAMYISKFGSEMDIVEYSAYSGDWASTKDYLLYVF
jgi:hypothetical protein